MNIFSTRETAIIIWAIVIIIVMLLNKEIRKSVGNIVKMIFLTKIIQPFIGIMIYLSIILLSFFKLGLVRYINLKEVLLWVLFSGVPLCYGVVNKEPNKDYIEEIIKDNIKFIILLEFIISTFTFPLKIELIIVPVFTFLFLLEIVSDMKEEYKDVNKLISYILSISGFIILYKSFSIAVKNYTELNYIESLISISTPIILSILYIPLIFIFGIIFNYNNIFYRLQIKLKYKYIKLKSGRFQKYDYKVEKVEDISNGLAKRKSIMLILKEKYEYKDIENICMEQFDLYNYKNDVVWVYVATSKESYIISNWIVQSQWINPKLDSRWRPGEINGVNRNGILFRYND